MNIYDYIKERQKAYQGSYFAGPWNDDAVDRQADLHAIETLTAAIKDAADKDIRTPDLLDAIKYLKGRSSVVSRTALRQYEQALSFQDPDQREMSLKMAVKSLTAT